MKIQFIVVGWHYHQQEFYEGLKELENTNQEINVFWSCHKEPTEYIKDNFNYKLFPNVGEEFVAYQQAIDYLKFLGTCLNYPLPSFDPTEVYAPMGIKEEFDNKTVTDYAQDETQKWFDKKLAPVMVIRGSFICCKYSDLKAIYGFEPRKEAWVGPKWSDEYQKHCYRGAKGLGKFGNMFMFMFSYKINRVFGPQCISYLSNRYLDSDYIYEMGRGEIDPNNPML